MSDEKIPLLERVASYYSQLSTVAADLNAVSDELGKSIAEIDAALKKLNLGITTWVKIHCDDGNPFGDSDSFWSRDIGYAKVSNKWGISLRTIDGQHSDPDRSETEEWLFNDAPRSLRLEAIDKIPELLEKLSKDAVKTTKDIRARLGEAQAVAEAIKGAASSPVRKAVCAALVEAGHVSAAQLLGAGSWTLDGASLRIEVAGMGKKILALTVNAAAEKIIRQELQRLGAPTRFLLVPGEGIVMSTTPITASDYLSDVSKGVEK
jgi:hypothetical protein